MSEKLKALQVGSPPEALPQALNRGLSWPNSQASCAHGAHVCQSSIPVRVLTIRSRSCASETASECAKRAPYRPAGLALGIHGHPAPAYRGHPDPDHVRGSHALLAVGDSAHAFTRVASRPSPSTVADRRKWRRSRSSSRWSWQRATVGPEATAMGNQQRPSRCSRTIVRCR